MFAQTDPAPKAANKARANILAPENDSDAAKRYRHAEDKLQRGRSIESIKQDLDAAAQSLRLAVTATRLAGVTLTPAMQARNDANVASADDTKLVLSQERAAAVHKEYARREAFHR